MEHLNFRRFQKNQPQLKIGTQSAARSWWTPFWRGLVADREGKHRKAMGAGIWLYLYLLTYANRSSGIVRRKQKTMAEETCLPVRTIQRHLKKLIAGGYITSLDSARPAALRIEKWKTFNHANANRS